MHTTAKGIFDADRCWTFHFTSAAVAVDSTHMTASSSASWSRFKFCQWARINNVVHGLMLATITGRWLDETSLVQVCMTWALTCPETVQQRPCMTRETETWLSDTIVCLDRRNCTTSVLLVVTRWPGLADSPSTYTGRKSLWISATGFLQPGCPSCHPTKALKGTRSTNCSWCTARFQQEGALLPLGQVSNPCTPVGWHKPYLWQMWNWLAGISSAVICYLLLFSVSGSCNLSRGWRQQCSVFLGLWRISAEW